MLGFLKGALGKFGCPDRDSRAVFEDSSGLYLSQFQSCLGNLLSGGYSGSYFTSLYLSFLHL